MASTGFGKSFNFAPNPKKTIAKGVTNTLGGVAGAVETGAKVVRSLESWGPKKRPRYQRRWFNF